MTVRILVACRAGVDDWQRSTLARLLARDQAAAGRTVILGDFDLDVKVETRWSVQRRRRSLTPAVGADSFGAVGSALRARPDVLVLDGGGVSDEGLGELARAADLVVIPCRLAAGDIRKQRAFAAEFVRAGVVQHKLVFVITRAATDAADAAEARRALSALGCSVAQQELVLSSPVQDHLDSGFALSETSDIGLSERANALAAEIRIRLDATAGRTMRTEAMATLGDENPSATAGAASHDRDLNFKVSPEFRRRFKLTATSLGISMKKLLEMLFQEFEGRHGEVAGSTRRAVPDGPELSNLVARPGGSGRVRRPVEQTERLL